MISGNAKMQNCKIYDIHEHKNLVAATSYDTMTAVITCYNTGK